MGSTNPGGGALSARADSDDPITPNPAIRRTCFAFIFNLPWPKEREGALLRPFENRYVDVLLCFLPKIEHVPNDSRRHLTLESSVV